MIEKTKNKREMREGKGKCVIICESFHHERESVIDRGMS